MYCIKFLKNTFFLSSNVGLIIIHVCNMLVYPLTLSSQKSVSTAEYSANSICVTDAIDAGDVGLLRDMLEKGKLNINQSLEDGVSLLMYAIRQNKTSVAKFLIGKGANVNLCGQKMTSWSIFRNGTTETPMSPLQLAISKNNSAIILDLLDRGADVTSTGEGFKGLLYLAIQQGDELLVEKIVELSTADEMCLIRSLDLTESILQAIKLHNRPMVHKLVQLGANVNREHHGTLPLVCAANTGDLQMTLSLINLGASLDNMTSCNLGGTHTPLSLAIKDGLGNAVRMLLLLGSDANAKVSWSMRDEESNVTLEAGSSMLHLAVLKSNVEVLEKLVSCGANLNQADRDGNTPLHIACLNTSGKCLTNGMLDFLLNHEAQKKCMKHLSQRQLTDINLKTQKGVTALMVAARRGNIKCVERLLEAGAELDLKDRASKTALHHAVSSGNLTVVKLLLDRGCNVDGLVNKRGCTPLHEAIMDNKIDIAKTLLDRGANSDVIMSNRETVLHLAVTSGNPDLVELCVRKGADVNATTALRETPLIMAARNGCCEICQKLLQYSANMDMQDQNRETALSLSVYYRRPDSTRLLICHGANLNMSDKW